MEDEVLMQMTEKKHPKGRKKSRQREMLCESVMKRYCKMKDISSLVPHSWKIPRMEEPGRLQSMGWLRVGHYQLSYQRSPENHCLL